ncbi:MAG: hypothetical protein OEY06_01645 [Gammaproteobacteria bacterium]|nr:hypothetical protein [Gammaproteobacteria bacterium]
MATKKEKAANSEDDVIIKNENNDTIAEESTKKESKTMVSMLMALIVAIPAGMIVAYVAMPGQVGEVFSSSSTANNESSNVLYAHPGMPGHANAGSRNQHKVPDWVAHQREQIEKRRANFDRQNAERKEATRNSAEPPQWVKNQQEWAKRSSANFNNRPQTFPGYMNNSRTNGYPQNQAPVYSQNPAPYYNGYAPPTNPYQYNNGPYNAPQNMPYSQNSYSR